MATVKFYVGFLVLTIVAISECVVVFFFFWFCKYEGFSLTNFSFVYFFIYLEGRICRCSTWFARSNYCKHVSWTNLLGTVSWIWLWFQFESLEISINLEVWRNISSCEIFFAIEILTFKTYWQYNYHFLFDDWLSIA